jgi:segregation and condensation protein A
MSPLAADEYKVRLEVFEGPLDLLLYLIKREEIDIYDIPIERITTQYLEYLSLLKMLDLNIAGEFIVMAATLLMIKSRMLLPVEERPETDDEEEADPRWDLVRQLLEYKKFKDVAGHLQSCELRQLNMFTRGADPELPPETEGGLGVGEVSLFDLIAALNKVLKNAKTEELGQIFAEQYTVADKIESLLDVVREQQEVSFSLLFGELATRGEVVCTFLALLELIRLHQLGARQSGEFGEIVIFKAEGEPALAPDEDVAAANEQQE